MSFNGTVVTPSYWSDREIRVPVPAGAASGPVVVTVGGVAGVGTEFTVTGPGRSGPGIATVSPALGPARTEVVVRGENFGPASGVAQGTSGVSIGGVWGTPSYWSDREIRVPVPSGASSGRVAVAVNGRESEAVGFAVTPSGTGAPAVASVSPEAGPAGTEVVVRGENFGSASGVAQGTSGVSFSGVWGRPTYWSDREIRVPVPAGAPGGLLVVATGGLAGNGVPFRVTGPAPVIASVDPNHGPAGTEVVIRGTHFGSPMAAVQGAGRVSFNGTAGRPTYWSDREIRVPVPAGAESGLVMVTAGGTAGNGVEFTMVSGGKGSGGRAENRAVSARSSETAVGESGPAITSLQPLEGAVGTAVRITGANFGATAGELGRVSFNGARGVPTSWSETAIQVPVPSGATTGPVTVTAQAGGVSNGVDFNVLPPIAFEAGAAVLSEPDGETTISVRRFPERMSAGSTVTISHEGSATPGSDYRLGSLDFPAGADTASATLQVLDDSDYEGNEEIEIVAVVRDLLGGSRSFRLKILLVDDDAPALAISAPAGRWEWRPPYRVGVSVPEGAEPAADTPVTFTFGGTAERGSDFEMAETVTLPAGRGHAWTRLAMIDDTHYELLEKIVLQATAPGYRASPEAEVYIFDDDATPLTLTFDRLNLSEAAGERTATYTVSVAEGKEPAADSEITVGARGTARLWRDFRWDVTLVLRAGQRSVTGTFRVINDSEYEGTETITLTAQGRTGTGLGLSSTVTIEIADDDPPPLTLALSPEEVSEPDGTATLTVTAAVAPETTSTVTLLKTGSATGGVDYTVEPLTMEPGERTATARLEVTDDAQYEGPETIVLGAHMEGYAYSFPLRIPLADDEPVPLTLSVDRRRVSEAGGTATLTVSIPRSGSEPVEFTLSRSGTATGGSDYTLAETVTIRRNGRSATVTLQAIDDETYEGRETVEIRAGADGYATSRVVTVAIEDDDPLPLTLSVSPAEVSEAGGTATLMLAVPEAVSAPVEFTLSRSGTATGGSDYTLAEAVTIPAGRLSATVTLQAIDDAIDEGRETVEIQAGADGYATSPVATVAIHDDDSSGVTVAPTHLNLAEGGSGQYVVRLDSQPLHPVTIAVASDNPDVGAFSPLTFSAADWDRVQAVTVTAAYDDDFADESATLTHTADSADLNYRGIAVPGVAVDVTDEGNRPPACGSVPARSLLVGRSETVDLSAYCSDPDGHPLNYTAISSAEATVTAEAIGSTLRLTGVALGSATVTVTVTDGHGGSATVTFPVTVPNSPPVCRDIPEQILWVADSQSVDLSAYCSDPDGHPLRYTAVSSNEAKVTESVSGSRLTLTGVAVGSARIKVTATDDPGGSHQGLSTRETFTARVENRDPVCEAIGGQTVEVGQSKTLTVSCTDGDGHELNYTASASPSGIVTVTPEGNPLTLTGVAVGSAAVTVTVTDRHRGSAEVNFPVTVPNRRPVCRDIPEQILWVADSLSVDLSAYCSDPDGHPLRYTAVSLDEAKVTESVSGSRLTLTGRAVGSARIRVTATDDPGRSRQRLSTRETFTARVENRDPVCEAIGGRTVEVGQSKTLTVSCTDGDGHTLAYSADSSDTNKVRESMNGSRLTIAGVAATASPHPTVTVTVTDGHGGSDKVTFSVTVNQPHPPCGLSAIGGQELIKGVSTTLGLSSARGETYSATSSDTTKVRVVEVDNAGDTLTIRGIAVTTSPHPTVTVTVRGAECRSDSETFTVTVKDPPDPPEILSFTADSTTICPGDCTYLRWETRFADSTLINEGIGNVTPVEQGSKRVCPNEIREYDYILTAIGNPRAIPPEVTRIVTVTVLPSCGLSSIGGQALLEDEERTLGLSSACNGTYSASSTDTGVVTASVDNARNKLTITGESAGTATVTVRVTKPGFKEDSVTFTVTVKPRPPVIDSFEASPASITEGSCTTLSWTTTDANSVSMSPAIGSVVLSVDGSGSVCPDSTDTYTLTATGDSRAMPSEVSKEVTVTVTPPTPTGPSTPEITSISPSLQRPDDPVTIYGNHFGSTAGSVSFGGHSISIFSGPGYSWSNTSIGLLIPGSLYAGQVSVTVTANGGSTSAPYTYTVTGGPVHRGDCGEEDGDCPEEKENRDEESGDSEEGGTEQGSQGSGGGETEEGSAEGGG